MVNFQQLLEWNQDYQKEAVTRITEYYNLIKAKDQNCSLNFIWPLLKNSKKTASKTPSKEPFLEVDKKKFFFQLKSPKTGLQKPTLS